MFSVYTWCAWRVWCVYVCVGLALVCLVCVCSGGVRARDGEAILGKEGGVHLCWVRVSSVCVVVCCVLSGQWHLSVCSMLLVCVLCAVRARVYTYA